MLIKLFLSFIKIGLFSIGGGMASIPIIKNEIIDTNAWLSLSEFSDLISIAEMTPGPIAVNSASFVGAKVAGILGSIVATIGVITPSIFIIAILYYLYSKYKNLNIISEILTNLRPVIISLILSAGISIFNITIIQENNNINHISIIIFIFTALALNKTKLNPIFIMILAGTLGTCLYLI